MAKDQLTKVREPDYSYTGYTYADYLNFQIDDMVEVIRGKLFKMSSAPGSTHQMIAGKMYLIIGPMFRNHTRRAFIAPFDVILPLVKNDFSQSNTVVQPDLCVIGDPAKIQERGCFGAPDWVIEILSPHTSKKDIQLKYDVYEEAGVKEYWIVMPRQQIVEVYILQDGKYERRGAYAYEDTVTSTVFPEVQVTLSEVFEAKAEW